MGIAEHFCLMGQKKMSKKIAVDIYYDVISPFAWIGFEGLLRYQKVWPISVNLKPFFIWDIMTHSGNRSPMFNPIKAKNLMLDVQRNNEFWGLDLRFPKNFKNWITGNDTTTENALKLLIAIQMDCPRLLETTSRAYWNRLWHEGNPIFNKEDHEIVLKSSGVPNTDHFFARMNDLEVGERLKKNTKTAMEQGCFGAPWIVVHKDGQEHAFFGSDRFHYIAHLIGENFTHGHKDLIAKI